MAREAVSTADDTSPLHGVSRRLVERQVQTSPWCLEYRPEGYTMTRRAHDDRLGSATVALCPEDCATMAHVYVGGTTAVPSHCAGVTLAHCPPDGATVSHGRHSNGIPIC